MVFGASTCLLRDRKPHEHSKVTFVELFFDLVFVFAITQLSHYLLEHFSVAGVLQTALMLMAVWWVWIYTSWATNWLDPQTRPVRLLLFALMLAGLVLSTSIPEVFGTRAVAFAGAYVFMQVGRCLFMLWALRRHDGGNYRNFLRITAWFALSALFWAGGAFADGQARFVLWVTALAIEYAAPACGFWTPGLGRSTTTDWEISGAHIAERCGLFMIIALGESILVTGATFGKMEWTAAAVAAFASAFIGSVAMWWIYFNIGAERAAEYIAASDDPGRHARVAYTYTHLLPVAGIIVIAVSDELVLAHPGGQVDFRTAATTLAGPALFLVGNLIFKRLLAGSRGLSHMVGLGLLVIAVPLAWVMAPLAFSAMTTAVLVVVAIWETRSLGGHAPLPAAARASAVPVKAKARPRKRKRG